MTSRPRSPHARTSQRGSKLACSQVGKLVHIKTNRHRDREREKPERERERERETDRLGREPNGA